MARAKDYGTFKVRETLPRPDGADLVVAYTLSGRIPTYASYRHEGGSWLALNESWTSLEKAVAETPGLDRSTPLRAPKLLRILTEALDPAAGCGAAAGAAS